MFDASLKVLLGFWLCVGNVVHASDATEEIVLVADKWCPYNCEPRSDKPGLLVEIARYAFERNGYKLSYVIRPWNRSILMVRKGDFDGIIGAGKDETPDFVFPDEPLANIEHTFYVNNSSTWRYTSLASLDTVNLGVIKNYSYGDLYERYIKPNQSDSLRLTVLHGDDAFNRLAQMLKRGRIDAFVEEKNIVAKYLLSPKAHKQIKPVGLASKEEIYIAFSPSKPSSKKYARILSDGYRQMKLSGKLKAIKRKYDLMMSE